MKHFQSNHFKNLNYTWYNNFFFLTHANFDTKRLNAQQLVVISSDNGDPPDSEIFQFRGAGEQRDVLSRRCGGDRWIPVCALAEPPC